MQSKYLIVIWDAIIKLQKYKNESEVQSGIKWNFWQVYKPHMLGVLLFTHEWWYLNFNIDFE